MFCDARSNNSAAFSGFPSDHIQKNKTKTVQATETVIKLEHKTAA